MNSNCACSGDRPWQAHPLRKTTRIETDILSFGSSPLESEPWNILYRMGEMVREHQANAVQLATTSPVAQHRPENSCGDEAAALRMRDEGCPN